MKIFKNPGVTGLFLLLFFCTGNIVGQNLMQEEPSKKIREMAKERTNMWISELALSAKQADLMERKIIEYTMKRTELMQSKMNEEAKKERFIALQVLEEKDMRDILTGPQHEKYIRLNRKGINVKKNKHH
ncbi:MAG TPA: hypothetical protein VLN46_07110 [Gillisia sp.]|nr:hypothetical protein [Gillisia sp.]